jgi:hypothetical protein
MEIARAIEVIENPRINIEQWINNRKKRAKENVKKTVWRV